MIFKLKAVVVAEIVKYDRRWRLSERARNLPCMMPGTATNWEQEAGKEANARARKVCATECPFRVDCYMTSWLLGDKGVIRGGIMLAGRVKMTTCRRCGLPAVRAGRGRGRSLCGVCVCSWRCHGCGQWFWIERTNEPKSTRQYHSEACRIESMRERIKTMRIMNLVYAA